MYDGLKYVAQHGLQHVAQDRGYQHANALLGGFDPIGLLAGLSFIAFLLHALLSFLFRPQQNAASFYLPASSRNSNGAGEQQQPMGHELLNSALEFYETMNSGSKNRH